MRLRGLQVSLIAVIAGVAVTGTMGSCAEAQSSSASANQGSAGERPMTFADLMAMKRVSDPQISPSGKWVMFSVTEVSLEKNSRVNHLWVVPLTGGDQSAGGTPGKEVQVTFGDGESNGRFSPDGKRVSLSMKDQVYLAPWDEAAGKIGEAKPLTSVAGGADGAVWSPDAKRLMFTAQVYPECSVKGGDEGLKSMDAAASTGVIAGSLNVGAWRNAEPATWAEEDACDKVKADAAEKSPVRAQVFEGLLYRHWEHYTGGTRSHILVVDADGKNVRDLTPASAVGDAETPTFFVGGPQEYAWAPDSREIAYVTNLDSVPAASTNNDVFTLRLDEPGAKAVKVSTSPGSDDEPEYSPDGKWLAFRSQARAGFESDRFRLMLMDREKGTTRELLPKFDAWVDDFKWGGTDLIDFAAGFHGDENLYGVSTQGAAPVLLAGGADFSDFSSGLEKPIAHTINPAPAFIVAVKMTADAPAEVVRIHLCDCAVESAPNELGVSLANGSNMTLLTHLNEPVLSQLDVHSLEPFWFISAEGAKVQGFLLKPPDFDPSKKYPVKFLMHGGPQTAWGDAWSYRWNWELMAASGYVVIGINRRGSTGYGQKFVDEVSGDWGGRAYEDLMKGLDYAEAHYAFIDKTRECALGASYGGFMANWVLTHTNRFKCIVTHDGMYDPVAAWGSTEEMWFNEWEFRTPADYPRGWDGFPADPKQTSAGHPAEPWRYAAMPSDQDPFRKWSPMRFIANAKTPTLIIHSQHDYRLDVSQGFEMFTALQWRGVPSKMLYFPDESHWVLKPQNSQLWYAEVNDWCDRWTHSGKYSVSAERGH